VVGCVRYEKLHDRFYIIVAMHLHDFMAPWPSKQVRLQRYKNTFQQTKFSPQKKIKKKNF
jgi:hypothetical protein